jgi:hypothetical protein
MTTLFNRVTRVTIENEGQERKTLGNVRTQFEIVKTQKSQSNTLTLTMYNLAEDTMNLLRGSKDGAATIELFAGYSEDVSLIYKGNVLPNGVVVSRQGTDRIVEVRCGDGAQEFKENKVSVSFSKGITVRQVIDDVIKQTGFDLGEIKGLDGIDGTFENGFSDIGPIRKVMDRIAKAGNVDWSVQDGAIQILGKEDVRDESAFLLNERTGLLGSPSLTKNGAKFQSLLLPKMNIGRQIIAESELITGAYKAIKVTHEGDNQEGPWFTTTETVEA